MSMLGNLRWKNRDGRILLSKFDHVLWDLSSHFSHFFKKIQSAEDVNLSGNGITANGLRAFEGVLQRNTSLKALDLSGNPIGDEGAKVPLSLTSPSLSF